MNTSYVDEAVSFSLNTDVDMKNQDFETPTINI